MLIPVRCFTCNKVIGHLWEKYLKLRQNYILKGDTETNANCKSLDELKLNNYCCRRMILGNVDVIDNLLLYSNNPGEKYISQYRKLQDEESDMEQEYYINDSAIKVESEGEDDNSDDNLEEVEEQEINEESDQEIEIDYDIQDNSDED
jgi:DNA-directed RNA polymerases I, II, and III subunit RPABC5